MRENPTGETEGKEKGKGRGRGPSAGPSAAPDLAAPPPRTSGSSTRTNNRFIRASNVLIHIGHVLMLISLGPGMPPTHALQINVFSIAAPNELYKKLNIG